MPYPSPFIKRAWDEKKMLKSELKQWREDSKNKSLKGKIKNVTVQHAIIELYMVWDFEKIIQ